MSRAKLVSLSVLGAVVAAAAAYLAHRSFGPPARATGVKPDPGVLARATRVRPDPYLPAQEFRRVNGRQFLTTGQGTGGSNAIVRADLLTGTEVALPNVSREYAAVLRSERGLMSSKALFSQDGKWVLVYDITAWETKDFVSEEVKRQRVVALAVDGTKRVDTSKLCLDASVAWCADSRHWVELAEREVVTHSVDDPAHPVRLPIKFLPGSPSPLDLGAVIGAKPGKRILTAQLPGYPSMFPPVFWEIRLGAAVATATPTPVKLPPAEFPLAVDVSSDGSRFAWLLVHLPDAPSAGGFGLHPLCTNDSACLRPELWISGPGGKALRRLGAIPEEWEEADLDAPRGSLFWSRDGRVLYFGCHRDLYRLNVP